MPIFATLSALAVVIAWGINFVVIKLGVHEIPPLALLAARFFIAGLVFLPFMKWPGLKQAAMIAGVGFGMGVLHQGTLFIGLEIMPASLMSLLLQTQIIMATVIGWLFLKEKIGWRTWAGIGIGLIGVVILLGKPTLNAPFIGYVYGLLSAFFIALTYVQMKRVSNVHGPTYIALLSLPIAPLIAVMSLFTEGTSWITERADNINWIILGGSLFYQAIVISISHIYWQRLMRDYPLSQVLPWTLLIPVFGIAAAIPVFGETLTWPIIIGGGLTLAGITIITFRKIKKSEAIAD